MNTAHRGGPGEPTTTPVRVAFYGRVTTDRDQQPLMSVGRQELAVRRVLESIAPMPSYYTDTISDDVASSRWDIRQARRGQR